MFNTFTVYLFNSDTKILKRIIANQMGQYFHFQRMLPLIEHNFVAGR